MDRTNNHIVSELTLSYWRNNMLPGKYKRREDGLLAYASQPIEYDAFYFSGDIPMILINASVEYEGSWAKVNNQFVRPY